MKISLLTAIKQNEQKTQWGTILFHIMSLVYVLNLLLCTITVPGLCSPIDTIILIKLTQSMIFLAQEHNQAIQMTALPWLLSHSIKSSLMILYSISFNVRSDLLITWTHNFSIFAIFCNFSPANLILKLYNGVYILNFSYQQK